MRISIDWRELAAQVLAYLLGCLSWVTAAEPSKTLDLLRRDLAAMARGEPLTSANTIAPWRGIWAAASGAWDPIALIICFLLALLLVEGARKRRRDYLCCGAFVGLTLAGPAMFVLSPASQGTFLCVPGAVAVAIAAVTWRLIISPDRSGPTRLRRG